MPAWFFRSDVTGPAPAVVMFDGPDNAKETSALFGGAEIAQRMRCPLYILHGGNDSIVPLEFAQKLCAAGARGTRR